MRSLTRAAIIAAVLFGVTLSALAQPTQKEPTGTISGRVTLSGKPLPGIIIGLLPEDYRYGPPRGPAMRATTDVDGRFRLAGVAAGRYYVTPFAPTYVGGNASFREAGKPVTVADGEAVENIDFKLTRGGVITGRVTDADGRPLIAERVRLALADERDGNRMMDETNPFMHETDDRGVYRIYGLAAGRYLVSVAGEEGGMRFGLIRGHYTRTFHPGVTDQSKATIIELAEGSEATNVDIELGRPAQTYAVSGRVLDVESGKPIANALIACGLLFPDRKGFSSVGFGSQSNADGKFRIEGLMPGRYSVFVSSNYESESYSDPVTFEVTEGDVAGLEIKSRRGASISGVVHIEGTSDRTILSKLSQLSVGASVQSKGMHVPKYNGSRIAADGSFRIPGLGPGKAMLYLANFPLAYKGITLVRVERDGVEQRDGIEVTPGAQITDVRVIVAYGTGVIRGQVKVEGGALPENARLMVQYQRVGTNPSARPAEVDARGRFVIEGLAAGDYELSVNFHQMGNPTVRVPSVRQTVIVNDEMESEVILVLDLRENQKERER